ncbi:MAG: GTP cyclohydrolase I FolE [Candidatus Nephthysia bennettiae]|uniref:GTP cyclohydrolase 1 n=1 Tax=Candidatus Nephthysia bennettiae TaxID=3127016 RepID=A0A934K134_9BACT|nr:GTP cyclohydrolase I FolE [Candidatus Dormibacteraeota bacterium]MBJ7611581.1 GTP cyclohydrolase I FolE [Candidatus Dormibacteraeota bacterium]PZR99388.1 MAG: GTP cyclohydrolase I FolE [Candidatus Dormibacteraeota bacterium]
MGEQFGRGDALNVAPQIHDRLTGLVRQVLAELGEDPAREGLVDTPERVARSLRYLTEGYGVDATDAIGDALFEQEYDEMVLVRDVQFYSLCEHHLLPFFGVAHVAYQPAGRVVGLSKIPRVIDVFAHRLQLQERMTRQIAEGLERVTRPHGVAVVVEARHLCMEMRGVEKVGGQTVTSCMLGCFREDARTRAEFLDLIHRHN